MVVVFRKTLTKNFEMIHLGLMFYFVGIEVIQQDNEIFVCQNKHIVKKFKMNNSKLVFTPSNEKLNLTRKIDDKRVNSTYYKSLIGSLTLTPTRSNSVFGVGLLSNFMK